MEADASSVTQARSVCHVAYTSVMSDLSLRYEIRPMIYTLSSVYPVSCLSPPLVIVCNEELDSLPERLLTYIRACVRSPDRKRGRRITHQGCGTVIIPPRTRPRRPPRPSPTCSFHYPVAPVLLVTFMPARKRE